MVLTDRLRRRYTHDVRARIYITRGRPEIAVEEVKVNDSCELTVVGRQTTSEFPERESLRRPVV